MSDHNLQDYFSDASQNISESDNFFKQLNELLDALGFAVYKSEKKSDGYSPWEKINKNGNTNCN